MSETPWADIRIALATAQYTTGSFGVVSTVLMGAPVFEARAVDATEMCVRGGREKSGTVRSELHDD